MTGCVWLDCKALGKQIGHGIKQSDVNKSTVIYYSIKYLMFIKIPSMKNLNY